MHFSQTISSHRSQGASTYRYTANWYSLWQPDRYALCEDDYPKNYNNMVLMKCFDGTLVQILHPSSIAEDWVNVIISSFQHSVNMYAWRAVVWLALKFWPLNGLWSGTTRVGRYQKKHSPTHTHPDHCASSSPFSICNGPWHPLYSTYVLDSPYVLPLSRSSLVLNPQLHAPYISSPSHRHLFATHDRTSAACSAAIPMLCQLCCC